MYGKMTLFPVTSGFHFGLSLLCVEWVGSEGVFFRLGERGGVGKEITSGFHFVLSFYGEQARRMEIASGHFSAQVSLQELPFTLTVRNNFGYF